MTENFYSFADLGAAYEQVLMAQDVAERMCPPGLVRFADATVDVVQNRMRETGIAKGFVDPRVREIMRDPKMGPSSCPPFTPTCSAGATPHRQPAGCSSTATRSITG